MIDKILKPKQLAEILGNSTKVLAYWRQTGYGPKYFKLTESKQGQVRYRESDIKEWMERKLRQNTIGE